MDHSRASRRRVLGLLAGVLAAAAGLPRRAFARATLSRPPGPHPEPRPGITAAKVLKPEQVEDPEIRAIFDRVREIPQVVDGIRCQCGCAGVEGYYSLLSCYEPPGMAQACLICQGEARLVYRLHQDGWSLNGIRAAVDTRYGT